jgi:hypothetical protein
MTARKSFLLRISPALYEQLEAWAQQEMRSVNGQIEFVLKEAVTRRKPTADFVARLSPTDDVRRSAASEDDESSGPNTPASPAGPSL